MSLKRSVDFIVGVPLISLFSMFNRSRPEQKPFQRILLIKLAAVGDTILLVPIIRALRKKYPNATIDWMVSSVNRDVASMVPGIDHLLIHPGFTLWGLIGLIRRVRREKYDVVIDLEQWARGTAVLAALSGAPVRLGFNTPGQHRHGVFTDSVLKEYNRHEIEDFYEVVNKAGPIERDFRLELWDFEENRADVKSLVPDIDKDKRLKVLMHPGSGSDGLPREWPLLHYAVIGQWLMKKYNARLFLTGGPEERIKTRRLFQLLNKSAVNLGGRLTWGGTIALTKKMDLVLSGNTGMMHIAAALQKKQVALHGPTNPLLWGPLNPNAKVIRTDCPDCPCLRLGFEYHRTDQACMNRISTDQVKAAIGELIDTAQADMIEGQS